MRSGFSVTVFGIIFCAVCILLPAHTQNTPLKPLGPVITTSTLIIPDQNSTFTCQSYLGYGAPELSWLFGSIAYTSGQVDVLVGDKLYNSSTNLTITMRKEDHGKVLACVMRHKLTDTILNDTKYLYIRAKSAEEAVKATDSASSITVVSIAVLVVVIGVLFGISFFYIKYSNKEQIKVIPRRIQSAYFEKTPATPSKSSWQTRTV
ncbi:uncharacterized protein LOC121386923 [Gigantopelta aegis]|uniref:uncharacterized protein LOC121386923 n=1 Tax=Gigantopelta aegis TaxID=1735272 RepID=UPI001B88E1D8|nr:uncharacterized protein LOC121386923 [Gigantopelta aegis]